MNQKGVFAMKRRASFLTIGFVTLLAGAAASPLLSGCSGADDPASPAAARKGRTPDPSVDPTGTVGGDGGAVVLASNPDPCDGKQEPRSCCLAKLKYGGRGGADNSCGPDGNESCCKFDTVAAASFNRLNDPTLPATVPEFKLGTYLVTTARFKVFMEEGFALQSKHPPTSPAAGSGAHPTLGNTTGWQEAWNTGCGGDGCLPKDDADLTLRVYKDSASDGWGCTLDHYPQQPNYPMSCIDHYLANAFCAWDGGYLITEAQWESAARGGAEQRPYAWGTEEPTLDHSTFCATGGGEWNVDLWCTNPTNPAPSNVGSARKGKGKYGTYDLMGNVLNWTTDDQGAPPAECTNDCVNRADVNRAVARGIAFQYPNNLQPDAYSGMMSKRPITVRKNFNGTNFGFRCAYPNAWTSP
jgi:formylglycine-generating enzyme required for sulfatase activity